MSLCLDDTPIEEVLMTAEIDYAMHRCTAHFATIERSLVSSERKILAEAKERTNERETRGGTKK